MLSTELHYLELLDVGGQIQSCERSSEEVTRAMLARIDDVDPALHCYATRVRLISLPHRE